MPEAASRPSTIIPVSYTHLDVYKRQEEEVADYVRHLEAATDAADSPAASGDAIAREFERYLRGRGEPDAPR